MTDTPATPESIRDEIRRLSREQKKRERLKKDQSQDETEHAAPVKTEPVIPVEVEQAIYGRVERLADDHPNEPEFVQTAQAEAEPVESLKAEIGADIEPAQLSETLRRAEAILFATDKPIPAAKLAESLPPGADIGATLMQLQKLYLGRGVQLVEIADGWRFQTASDLAFLFEETRQEERKLSKAALETLSIIAYCQPVTRAEIEDVRGVAVSKGTIDVLLEMNWVRVRGRRKTPGRPVTYGTTVDFLEHFGLQSLDDLPGREELKTAGLLSSRVPENFQMPRPVGSEAEEALLEEPEDDGHDTDFHTDFMSSEN